MRTNIRWLLLHLVRWWNRASLLKWIARVGFIDDHPAMAPLIGRKLRRADFLVVYRGRHPKDW
jgi:hypothetical protein